MTRVKSAVSSAIHSEDWLKCSAPAMDILSLSAYEYSDFLLQFVFSDRAQLYLSGVVKSQRCVEGRLKNEESVRSL
jgi:hypothetical protein